MTSSISHNCTDIFSNIPTEELNNDRKINLLYSSGINRWNFEKTICILENTRPKLQSVNVLALLRNFEDKFSLAQFELIAELFDPQAEFEEYGSPSYYQFSALERAYQSRERHPFYKMLIEKYSSYYTSPPFLNYILHNHEITLDYDFIKLLHEMKAPALFFNTEIQSTGQTPLQVLAGRGEIEIVREIAKELPRQSIQLEGKRIYPDEIKECFLDTEDVDLSPFSPQGTFIAQNGCRAVVLPDEGGAYSFAGQSALNLTQQLMKGEPLDYLTIYQNSWHASLQFSDGTFYGVGSAPDSTGGDEVYSYIARATLTSLATLPIAFRSSFRDYIASQFFLQSILGTLTVYKTTSAPCKVDPRPREGITHSNARNELKLTLYGPERRISIIKEEASRVKEACTHKNQSVAPYSLFFHNCVDYVQDTLRASGSKANYRDAFSNMQYLRRIDTESFFSPTRSINSIANVYALATSSSPTLEESPLDVSTGPEFIDQLPRETFKAVGFGAVAIPTLYLMYKSFKKTVRAIGNLFTKS